MTTSVSPEEIWGPMAQPIHTSVPGNSKAVYRDNVYATFWDTQNKAHFTVHGMSTPNGPSPMVRVSADVDGAIVEFIEPIEQKGTHDSKSMHWDHAGRIVVNHPELSLDVRLTPRFIRMDDAFVPSLPPMGGAPIRHFERTVDVKGTCVIKGRKVELSAQGYRDRSIGFRDESLLNEYVWYFATFPKFTVTFLRMVSERENFDRQVGYVYDDKAARRINKMAITRNASGLFAAARFEFEDGGQLKVRTPGRLGGFWIPMGWEREGPTMSVFQEFCPFRTDDGAEGFGNFEQGCLRKIF